MIFSVGDLVQRTVKPYNYWLGIVVKIDIIKKKLYKSRPPQDYYTIWVKWTLPETISKADPESYWVEDLTIVSKAKKPIPPLSVKKCNNVE